MKTEQLLRYLCASYAVMYAVVIFGNNICTLIRCNIYIQRMLRAIKSINALHFGYGTRMHLIV